MAKKQVDQGLCERFTKVRAFYAPSKAQFAKLFELNAPSLVSDIERGAREPSQSLLNKIIARGDVNPRWLLEGEGEAFLTSANGPKPAGAATWRKAVEDLEAALKARGLSKGATEAQRNLLVEMLVQGQQAGAAPEELQRQLGQLVDLLEGSIRRRKGG